MRVLVIALVTAGVAAWLLLARDDTSHSANARLDVGGALAVAPDSGFARATEPRVFRFPRDHGPHPEYRTEWWYFTGNLRAADGRAFGYQLTFFRSALSPDPVHHASAWAARDVYMAHLAVTDVATGELRACERFARGALGLAAARGEPPAVWLEDWRADWNRAGDTAVLRAHGCGIGVDLRVARAKPEVLNGTRGLSKKGPEPGNASYYYSWTRAQTEGRVTFQGQNARVRGTSWLDREWGTTHLSEGIEGWDWFALQLSDATELMLYVLRRENGTPGEYSAGTFVRRDGSSIPLDTADFRITATGRWRNDGGDAYPSGWRIEVPRLALSLDVEPAVADQELVLTVRYWEGAVRVRGERAGVETGGVGYVELTGYAERARGTRASTP